MEQVEQIEQQVEENQQQDSPLVIDALSLEIGKVYTEKISFQGIEHEVVYNTNYSTDMGKMMMNNINKFDNASWSAENKGVRTGFPMFDNAFQNGVPSGFYMIASYPNVGKSTILTQITYQMLENNTNIHVLDFSLDDPMIDKISRLVGSWVKMDSKIVKFPNGQSTDDLAKRKAGLAKLINHSDKYLIFDTAVNSVGSSIEKIEQVIESAKIELEKVKPDTQLVVMIDSFHDLRIESKPNCPDTERYTICAEWCADIAIRHNLVLITTGELNKGERNNTRPYPELIKGAGKILYEAKGIILLYNDVHANEDDAEVFWSSNNGQKKMPVLEAHICKNKISSWKGRLFYTMYPDMGALIECDEQQTAQFKNTIYGK